MTENGEVYLSRRRHGVSFQDITLKFSDEKESDKAISKEYSTDTNEEAETQVSENDVNEESSESKSEEASLHGLPLANTKSQISTVSFVSQVISPLDTLTDQQLVRIVNEMKTDLSYLKLENGIFREFLEKNDKSLLENFQCIFDFAKGEGPPPPGLNLDSGMMKRNLRSTICFLTPGPKINLSQKIELVMKASDDIRGDLDAVSKVNHRNAVKLKSELAEFLIRESDIKTAKEMFEYSIVTHGVDKLTQRIPAEKFVKYMSDWIKSAAFDIEKLRLRTASLKINYKKVCQTLTLRKELRSNVHAVDFDRLQIENKNFIEKIEQKNNHLIEMKKMNGNINLVLSKHKKCLLKQLQEVKQLKNFLCDHARVMAELEKESDIVAQEANQARDKLDRIKSLKKKYTVPDVMEYIKIKEELNQLKKEKKMFIRKNSIQDITLNSCIRQMKEITGCTDVDSCWLVQNRSSEDFDKYII